MVLTFLPYPDILLSIQCLDRSRISKQKLEARQILSALRENTRLCNHPATKMWKGYEDALSLYLNTCIDECVRRGYKNSIEKVDVVENPILPWWFGWNDLHRSHQASLVRKHPLFYTPIFTSLDPIYLEKGYVWPSKYDEYILTSDNKDIFSPINIAGLKSSSKSKELLYTVVDLKKMCKGKGIKGYSKLKKSELMTLLEL